MLVRGRSRRFDDLAAAVPILLWCSRDAAFSSQRAPRETEQLVFATISAPLREILIGGAL
jgi:hypothetical protein